MATNETAEDRYVNAGGHTFCVPAAWSAVRHSLGPPHASMGGCVAQMVAINTPKLCQHWRRRHASAAGPVAPCSARQRPVKLPTRHGCLAWLLGIASPTVGPTDRSMLVPRTLMLRPHRSSTLWTPGKPEKHHMIVSASFNCLS